MRDIVLADTVYIAFTTRAFATGIPTVLAGTPVVSAYEDAGLTQITAGITLGVDHDGVVGLNMLTIVATGANGYENDKDYNLVVTTGTVGGVSVVGEVVGQFSIQRAPVNWANVSNPTTALDLSGTDIQLVDTVTTYTGNTLQTADVNGVPTTAEFNARTLLAASYFDPAADAVANVTLVATTTTNTDMRGTDSAALASVATEARLAELDAANLPTDVAAIPTTAMRGTDSAALASVATEARLAELDAANLPTDVAAIPTTAMRGTDSAALASSFTFTVAGFVDSNAQYWNDTLITSALETAASVNTAVENGQVGTDAAATNVVVDNLNLGIIYGTTSGTPTTTSTNTDLTGYLDSELVGRVIVFTGGTADGQAAPILTYTATSGVVTFAALTTVPAASDPFKIV